MSLFGDYIAERMEKNIVEDERGFATYAMDQESCYIEDLYVAPEYRKSGVASEMADKVAEIAKKNGCVYLLGSVNLNTLGATDSMKVLLSYGMSPHSAQQNMVYFIKRL